MRNKFPGPCYRCGKTVPKGAGHFERHAHGWRVQHAECAIKHRNKAPAIPPETNNHTMNNDRRKSIAESLMRGI